MIGLVARPTSNKISMFMSVCVDEQHAEIRMATDQGRVCRSLIIVEHARPLVLAKHIARLRDGLLSLDDLVHLGLLEFLNVNEGNNALVAFTEEELEPMTVLGAVAGPIPFPHHNQSPHNTYQCAMGKQAMGVIGTNRAVRCDHLCYAQAPMVQMQTIQTLKLHEIPAGCNATLAVMNRYDIEVPRTERR